MGQFTAIKRKCSSGIVDSFDRLTYFFIELNKMRVQTRKIDMNSKDLHVR